MIKHIFLDFNGTLLDDLDLCLDLLNWHLKGQNKKLVKVYPARTKYRGFSEDCIKEGHKRVADYLVENAKELRKDLD